MDRKSARKKEQISFEFRTWGGRRKGAGRPRTKARECLPHRARSRLKAYEPQHVTLRLAPDLSKLRNAKVFALVARAIVKAERKGFSVSAWSIQDGHLHLITEAGGWKALSNGVRALEIRIARALNKLLKRIGQVFVDRYHARGLSTPREVRTALIYVLQNARKHFEQRGIAVGREWLDRFSSAAWFDGWNTTASAVARTLREALERGFAISFPPVTPPRTWLLSVGWRKHGLLATSDAPRTA